MIKNYPMLLVCGETTHRHLAFTVFETRDLILKHKAIGIPTARWAAFAVAQSVFHELWAWKFGLRRKEDLTYLPKRCSETFPLPFNLESHPTLTEPLDQVGQHYHAVRQEIMLRNREGLTETYNRLHDPSEKSPDITELRNLHQALTIAVATAYDWPGLELAHDFYATKQGVRFTLSEPTRGAMIQGLIALNRRRHEEEARVSIQNKSVNPGAGRRASRRSKLENTAVQGELL
jgi:hypothetical protein